MTFVPMSSLSLEARVTLWNRAYEGYAVPAHFDASIVERMQSLGDLDDERSLVMIEDGEPVAFAALGLRGERAWLGGFGVVAARRRVGLGRRVLEAWFRAAVAAGARHARLEVLEPNLAAHALYASHGFRDARWLEVWSLTGAPTDAAPAGVEVVPIAEALAALDAFPSPADPWQREVASIRNLGDAAVGLRAGRSSSPQGVAVLVPGPGRVGVMQLRSAANEAGRAAASALLDAAIARAEGGPVRCINVDPEDSLSTLFRTRGGQLEIRQYEMTRSLEP